MFAWIYDIPSLLAIAVFGLAFVAICWAGTLGRGSLHQTLVSQSARLQCDPRRLPAIFRRHLRFASRAACRGTYQNHADAEKAVETEAAALAALYRDVSAYPEPYRTDLRAFVRDYTRSTIEEAWPLQRQRPSSYPERRQSCGRDVHPHEPIRACDQGARGPSTRRRSDSSTHFWKIDGNGSTA
jgi:hypothetical protein